MSLGFFLLIKSDDVMSTVAFLFVQHERILRGVSP